MDKITRMADIQFRDNEQESRTIEGVACVFNQVADLGWFTEEIDRNAFAECDMSDVVLNFNHDNNLLLARTANDSLFLYLADDGLHPRASIIDTSTGEDILKMVRNRLISKMSFAFTIGKNGEKWIEEEGKKPHRIITNINRLFDVSLVTFPAYEQTSVSARNTDKLAEEHKQYLERLQKQEEKMRGILNGKIFE